MDAPRTATFDPAVPPVDCDRCPRLVRLRQRLQGESPTDHGAPVPAFGPMDAGLLVVGLAPGRDGAHRSGRPFSGDGSGALLFQTLHAHGFANRASSIGPGDGLMLDDCRITNAVKCLPPDNRPTAAEATRCAIFLEHELARARLVVALGGLAHRDVIRALGHRQIDHPFSHGVAHRPASGPVIIDSYHCSRYNLNTRRLTPAMFDEVFRRARTWLSSGALDA